MGNQARKLLEAGNHGARRCFVCESKHEGVLIRRQHNASSPLEADRVRLPLSASKISPQYFWWFSQPARSLECQPEKTGWVSLEGLGCIWGGCRFGFVLGSDPFKPNEKPMVPWPQRPQIYGQNATKSQSHSPKTWQWQLRSSVFKPRDPVSTRFPVTFAASPLLHVLCSDKLVCLCHIAPVHTHQARKSLEGWSLKFAVDQRRNWGVPQSHDGLKLTFQDPISEKHLSVFDGNAVLPQSRSALLRTP